MTPMICVFYWKELLLIWIRYFDKLLNAINNIGTSIGPTFNGDVDDNVNSLDVTTKLENVKITTSLYIKPTDAQRYLNLKSDHIRHIFGSHTYHSFNFGELRWYAQTKKIDWLYAIEYMAWQKNLLQVVTKYRNSEAAKIKTLGFDRD